jgi:hypothetical protein
MANPNLDPTSTTQYSFILSSYYDSNIYLGHKMCTLSIDIPKLYSTPVRSCTLNVNNLFTNKGITTQYTFEVTCQDNIKNFSELWVYMDVSYNDINKNPTYPCSAL